MAERTAGFWVSKKLQFGAAATLLPAAFLGAKCAEGSDGGAVVSLVTVTPTTVRIEALSTPTIGKTLEPTATIAGPTSGSGGGIGKGSGSEFTPTPTEVPATATPLPTQRPTEVPVATAVPTPRPTEVKPTAVPTPTVVPTPTATEKPPFIEHFDDAKAAEIIAQINQYRTSQGLPPYKLDSILTTMARRHAKDQAPVRTFSHTGTDGTSVDQRMNQAGYPGGVGEIVAGSIAFSEDTLMPAVTFVNGWKASPGHNGAMINPGLYEVGASCAIAQWVEPGNLQEVCVVEMGVRFK